MANIYTQGSCLIPIPEDKRVLAAQIMARVERDITTEDEENDVAESAEYVASLVDEGVLIHHDESLNVEQAAYLVEALAEELDLPGMHVMEFAHTCSAPRPGEFGGGAFVVQKGMPTVWVDAKQEALRIAKTKELRLLRRHLVEASRDLPFSLISVRDFSADLTKFDLVLFEDEDRVKVIKNRRA